MFQLVWICKCVTIQAYANLFNLSILSLLNLQYIFFGIDFFFLNVYV